MKSRHSLLFAAILLACATSPVLGADPAPAPQPKPMPGPGPMQPDKTIDAAQRADLLARLRSTLAEKRALAAQ